MCGDKNWLCFLSLHALNSFHILLFEIITKVVSVLSILSYIKSTVSGKSVYTQ